MKIAVSIISICLLLGLKSEFGFAQIQRGAAMETEKSPFNRLKNEKSPYLLQHADNPVNWFSWGDEAFNLAKKENKLIFLSIGYSTCHWCHVMEHESFENEQVAQRINEYFIPIKVDREERPDIDNIYMSAVMAMTGSGGWPLTIILTPDKKPVYGGTYFPPFPKWQSPGLMDIMESVYLSWKSDPNRLTSSAETLTKLLEERKSQTRDGAELHESVLASAFDEYNQSYDSVHGGFGYAPKFPMGHNLSYLLSYFLRSKNSKALTIVENTLELMAKGGIYDQLGGGFHRYSTDTYWQIPHFEKMLYDQAILSKTYLEAFQLTRNKTYERIAREIFNYVLRDMTDPKGGFYSAEDADSLDPDVYEAISIDPNQKLEKREGSFYLWRQEEIIQHLKKQDADIFIEYFGIEQSGNAKQDPHQEFVGKNVLFVGKSLEEAGKKLNLPVEKIEASIQESKEILLRIRSGRPRPQLDDKVLVDWSGLMISSLAYGFQVLNDPEYLESAQKAAQFILNNLVDQNGRLLHRYRDNESAICATIEDYAFFVQGLLDLYEASGDFEYLKRAEKFSTDMLEFYADQKHGGFYFTANDAEKLLFREKEVYDGAIPSGNSIAARNLVRLYHITFNEKWEHSFNQLFNAFGHDVSKHPSAYAQLLMAYDFALGPALEIVLSGKPADQTIEEMKLTLNSFFLPNKVIVYRPENEESGLFEIAPFVQNQGMINNKPTAYICENKHCQLPVNDVSLFEAQLTNIMNKVKNK